MATRVLLVDKHVTAAQQAADLLVDYGCHVRVAVDGAQALKELAAAPYDLVLTEMGASPEAGLELARAIRRAHPHTRVVVAAGDGGTLLPLAERGGIEVLFDMPEPRRILDLIVGGGPRGAVLVVDDQPEDMDGVAKLLRAQGSTVFTAQSGEAAVEIARRRKIDAAVIDFRMPGMSGWDTYKALKKISPEIRAVVVTGCSLDSYVQSCFDADDVPVINKTFDPREMFKLVSASLGEELPPTGESLLLVDDDASTREDMAEILRAKGYFVLTVGDGASALALAKEVAFDLAVVDCVLPDIPGLALIEKFREGTFTGELLVLTGHPDVGSAAQAVHLKVCEYLSKPLLPEKFLEAVRRSLRQRRLERRARDLARELHHANQKLEDFDRMKSRFLFIAAHDIRSPLSAVTGFAQYLLQKETLTPVLREALESIERGAEHIGRLTGDIVDLGRMESGKLAVRPEKIALGKFLEDLRKRLEEAARAEKMELACDFARAPSSVEADPLRLEQIVGNLVGNALKHARRGKKVELAAFLEGDALALSVRDQGPGMAREVLEHVFEPYYQAEGEASGKGIGLGLSIVKELAEGHGGKAWAESAGPGTGSTFRVTIPLRPPEPPAAPGHG